MLVSDRLAQLDALWETNSPAASASDAVYATLRQAIVAGALIPGDSLIEEHLGRQFSISRTPVREALLRLETEHLAIRIPRRGLVVRSISEAEILDVYTVRVNLDGLAGRLAATEALPGEVAHLRWLNQMLSDAAKGDNPKVLSNLSNQFHLALAEASHNSLLVHFTRQIIDRIARFGASTLTYPGRAATGREEHERLLHAVEAHDYEAADELARSHMTRSREVRVKMLRERL